MIETPADRWTLLNGTIVCACASLVAAVRGPWPGRARKISCQSRFHQRRRQFHSCIKDATHFDSLTRLVLGTVQAVGFYFLHVNIIVHGPSGNSKILLLTQGSHISGNMFETNDVGKIFSETPCREYQGPHRTEADLDEQRIDNAIIRN